MPRAGEVPAGKRTGRSDWGRGARPGGQLRGRKSPFSRRKLDAAGVKPAGVRTLADVARLPFTTRDELKQSHPLWGAFLAVPFEDVLRVHMSSATTGRPLAFLYMK